jgi:transposase
LHGIANNLSIEITQYLDYAKLPPQEREDNFQPRWTLKRLVEWLEKKYEFTCCRETCRKALKKLGFSWKKAKKLLNKANKEDRAAFVKKLKPLLDSATQGKKLLIYIDEAHIHLDTDEGYGWSVKGERFWVNSNSPGLAKVSFYGVYLYNKGQVNLYPYDRANSEYTVDMLERIRAEHPKIPITIIWDGASYHRSAWVTEVAKKLNIEIQRLPAYSPDFMPVEHLWQWLREDVTYHTSYDSKEKLIAEVDCFQQHINSNPLQIADRLWTKTSLDFEQEKLRLSK